MKVIIDLQEEDYNTIINSLYYIPKQAMEMRVVEAIKVGTVFKQGCWVGIDEEPHEDWECNNCGFVIWADENIEKFHYCPNCGAKMEV